MLRGGMAPIVVIDFLWGHFLADNDPSSADDALAAWLLFIEVVEAVCGRAPRVHLSRSPTPYDIHITV